MKQLCIAAVLAGVLIGGCGSKDETVAVGADGTTMSASKDGKDITVKGPDGAEYSTADGGKSTTVTDDKGNTSTMALGVTEAQLGLPFYPGSVEAANGGMTTETGGVKSVVSMRTTKDDPEKAIAFYKDKVEGGTASNTNAGDMKMAALAGGKLKDGAEANITAMKQKSEDTQVTVTVQHGKK
jgi:hypothetical protein